MEKLTLETVKMYERTLIQSLGFAGLTEDLIEVLRIDLQIARFARRVLEAQAKGGKMVSPKCTERMIVDGVDAYCRESQKRRYDVQDIEQWKAMLAAAPDMLEDAK